MIRAETIFNGKDGADCSAEITGNAEAVAVEYATITMALTRSEGGQAILDRAMNIMEKEINEHEEKRSE